MAQAEAPAIAALFVVVFDQKVGYMVAWQRTLPGIDINGVEYQCLPSGLHGVREDLVYFTKETCAGVSAFAQEESDKQHRNASFAAVGVLVSCGDERLGSCWLHAEELRKLAREQARSKDDTSSLESFWERHGKARSTNQGHPPSVQASQASGYKRKRSLSSAVGDLSGSVAADHPALSLPRLLSTFGPLLFPLYRAALLRKRILLLGSTPVHPSCNFVYDLSLLSEPPSVVLDTVHPDARGAYNDLLFSVGISDITRLEKHEHGWLACTTDGILGEKKKLYDLLVELPSSDWSSGCKAWPILRTADGRVIKASQRDLRRFQALRQELDRFSEHVSDDQRYQDDDGADDEDMSEEAPLVRRPSHPRHKLSDPPGDVPDTIEPETWAAAAYRSLMSWASPGEMDAWEAEETAQDQALLDNSSGIDQPVAEEDQLGRNESQISRRIAMILVLYFGRLTTHLVKTLRRTLDENSNNSEEGDDVAISVEHMRALGLDSWSQNDRAFVESAAKLYFSREIVFQDNGIWMCGVRIC